MGIIKVKTKFRIKYDPKNAKYYSENKNAKELFEKLLSSSNKRCMYCGRNLYLMGTEMKGLKLEEVFFNREHTVNKKQDGIEYENLKHCKFNLAVACPICNNTKSKIINVEKKLLEKLQEKVCEEKECLSPCKEYLEVLKDFEEKNKIILQPLGLDRKEEHDIVYNTENLTFEINQEEDYSEREKNIINNHISRFLQKFEKNA